MDTSKNRMFYIIKQSAGPVKHNNSVINNDSHLLLSQPSLGLGFIVLGFICVLEPHAPPHSRSIYQLNVQLQQVHIFCGSMIQLNYADFIYSSGGACS